jgi:hypothetical protein
MTEQEQSMPVPTAPAEALKRLNVLVGTWDMRGRTMGAGADDIQAWSTFAWLPGGHFMTVTGEVTVQDFHVQSMEVIGYDAENDAFTSWVFSNLSDEVSHYGWNVVGDVVTHWDETSIYTGHLSADGQQLIGGWRPKPGQASHEGNTYDAVMTRRK